VDWISDPQGWLALGTLTALEIVLGIDNIIFIAILAGRLPKEQQDLARKLGLGVAMVTRIGLLLSLSWLMRLTEPLFGVLGHEISGRDLILVVGGLFLIGKSTLEIHDKLEGEEDHHGPGKAAASFMGVVVQIGLLDIVFSLDSVITAIGLAPHVSIMVIAIVIAVAFMLFFVKLVNDFVERHPTFKILALSFLILIGFALVGEGLELHVPKGYVYFSMGFATVVEVLNMRLRARRGPPVKLRRPDPTAAVAGAEGE